MNPKSVRRSRCRVSFPLRRETRGFYRSPDLRFAARKEARRAWIATDSRRPSQNVRCPTLRDCRLWFAGAKAFDPKWEFIGEIPKPLPKFF